MTQMPRGTNCTGNCKSNYHMITTTMPSPPNTCSLSNINKIKIFITWLQSTFSIKDFVLSLPFTVIMTFPSRQTWYDLTSCAAMPSGDCQLITILLANCRSSTKFLGKGVTEKKIEIILIFHDDILNEFVTFGI